MASVARARESPTLRRPRWLSLTRQAIQHVKAAAFCSLGRHVKAAAEGQFCGGLRPARQGRPFLLPRKACSREVCLLHVRSHVFA